MPHVLRVGRAEHGTDEDSRREYYRMKDIWCLHLYSFYGHLTVNGRRTRLAPGAVSIAPPWSELSFEYQGPSTQMSAFFTFTAETDLVADVPTVIYLDDGFDSLWQRMAEALDMFPLMPERVNVRIWDMLWSLVDRCGTSAAAPGQVGSRVRDAVHYIETRLAGPLQVAHVAAAVGVSPTHLVRLFRATFGTTVIGYIRWRRTMKARDLLLHTDMPIKRVAKEVGLVDIQHLYKIFHSELGQTPGAVRAGEKCEGSPFASEVRYMAPTGPAL